MRERNPEQRNRPAGEIPPDLPENDGTAAAQAQQFLTVGGQILKSALSGDSQAFLAASRQQSGQ